MTESRGKQFKSGLKIDTLVELPRAKALRNEIGSRASQGMPLDQVSPKIVRMVLSKVAAV